MHQKADSQRARLIYTIGNHKQKKVKQRTLNNNRSAQKTQTLKKHVLKNSRWRRPPFWQPSSTISSKHNAVLLNHSDV